MASRRYENLFFIRLVHSAYAQANKTLFTLEPTAACWEVMNKLALSFNQSGEGFSVAAAVLGDESQWRLEKPLTQEHLVLSFALFSDNTDFYPNSYLPFDTPGQQIYYFDNLDSNSDRTRHLTDSSGVTADLRLPMVSQGISGQQQGKTLPRLWNANGKLVPLASRLQVKQQQYRMDLSGLPAGRYRIEDEQEQRDFYLCLASFARRVPIAVIDIYMHRYVDSDYRVIEYCQPWQEQTLPGDIVQKLAQRQWALYFGRFRYYWQYKIKTQGLYDRKSRPRLLQIESANDALTFSPSFAGVEPQESELVFTSERDIHNSESLQPLYLYQYILYPFKHHYHHHHHHHHHHRHKKYWHLHRQLLATLPQPETPQVTFIDEVGRLTAQIGYAPEQDEFEPEQLVDYRDYPQIWQVLNDLFEPDGRHGYDDDHDDEDHDDKGKGKKK